MDFEAFITKTVLAAGELLIQLRNEGFSTGDKGNDPRNILTSVDTAVDAFITNAIRTTYPNHALYSEEGGAVKGTGAYQWVIDPIDGSSNFSRGIPHYAVCVGVLEDGVPSAGAVYNPITKELFSFTKGEGAFLNGTRLSVLPTTRLSEAWVLFHAGRREDLREWGGDSYRKLLGVARKTGNLASTALDTCFVAAGRVEASVYGTYSTLDASPALGILREAGGFVALQDGSEPTLSEEPQMVFVANTEPLLEELRTLLSRAA